MKKFGALVVIMALLSTGLYAGGPVVVEDVTVTEEKPASSTGALLPLIILGLIAIAMSSGDDDGPVNCM